MRLLAFSVVAIFASQSLGATFTGQTDLSFRLTEVAGGATQRQDFEAPVEVTVQTDYSTLNWSLSLDFDETIAGGPDSPFETVVSASAQFRSSLSMPLSFPNASGEVAVGDGYLEGVGSIPFSVTDRVVTASNTRASTRENQLNTSVRQQVFQVLNYPDFVKLHSVWGDRYLLGEIETDSGVIQLDMRSISVTVDLFEVLPGDFNSSGAVDAGDYTVWRDGDGVIAPLMTNYSTWENQYGSTAASPATPATIPVPEGSSLLTLLMTGQWLGASRVRRCL